MFGMFDDMFDFNGDGHLDAFEQGAQFGFIHEIMEEDKKRKQKESGGINNDEDDDF